MRRSLIFNFEFRPILLLLIIAAIIHQIFEIKGFPSFIERSIELLAIVLIFALAPKLSQKQWLYVLSSLGFFFLSLLSSNPKGGLIFIIYELKPLIISLMLLFIGALLSKLNYIDIANSASRNLSSMLYLFGGCYMISLLFLQRRGEVWVENNFEIMVPLILFIIAKFSWRQALVVGAVSLFSLSRSGIAISVALISLKSRINLKNIFLIGFASVFLILLSFFILLKTGRLDPSSVAQIDRIIFLKLFYLEMIESPLSIIFGHGIAAPLSSETCHTLRYYSFAFDANGDCYNVIFHGSVLRVIHTGGLLYLALILKILYEAFHFLPRKQIFLIMIAIILNGFSVAGFGNTFLLLPFILLVSNNHQKIRWSNKGK